MCSFTVTNKEIDLNETNHFSQRRGPDSTSIENVNGISFLHNLLHITGEIKPQPFIEDDIVCVLNGEIYNYKEFGDYESDGQCLIPLYKEYGFEFGKMLDGEFSICIVDFSESKLILVNDTFATKPLWFAQDGDKFGVASYESSLKLSGFQDIHKIAGNYSWKFDLKTLKEDDVIQLVDFDINQYKTTYDDWIEAFEKSISKRVANTPHKIFLGLSAGYDSGAITCELLNQNIDFKAYTIASAEDKNIISSRHSQIQNGEIINLSEQEYSNILSDVNNNCEDFIYKDMYKNYNIKGDKASVGLGKICSRANDEGYRIYLSGQGSDEIISDYGWAGNKIYNHSSFGGKFPNSLDGFFPWHSFYDGTQIQYLNKEEYVAGAYGIETRYPFLDTNLVQEFLWLSSDLKNKEYKAPLSEYLSKNNYPFQRGVKTGFQANKNLI